MLSATLLMEKMLIIEESDEDRVTAALDKEGWLSLTVHYKIGDEWKPDHDAGVFLKPATVAKLKRFLTALES